MYSNDTQIRVRYGETDQMSYVYYGNYALYFEVARVETLRKLDLTYKSMEQSGIIMPILELKCKYIKPAYYDDLLTITTMIKEPPTTRILFEYEIYRENGDLIHIGSTTLVFVNTETKRPCPCPDYLLQKLLPFWG